MFIFRYTGKLQPCRTCHQRLKSLFLRCTAGSTFVFSAETWTDPIIKEDRYNFLKSKVSNNLGYKQNLLEHFHFLTTLYSWDHFLIWIVLKLKTIKNYMDLSVWNKICDLCLLSLSLNRKTVPSKAQLQPPLPQSEEEDLTWVW